MKRMLPFLALCLLACNEPTHTQPLNMPGYDWSALQKVTLHYNLNEISAIRYDAKTGKFITVNDEQGILYLLNGKDHSIASSVKFGKAGDYEGLEIVGNTTYVLESNGDLTKVTGSTTLKITTYDFDEGKKIEFESMLLNDKDQWLMLVSKYSAHDKKESATHIYAFDLRSDSYIKGAVRKIPWQQVNDKLPNGEQVKTLHPSAIAQHPTTGDIYMVASIEKVIVIFDKDWQVKYAARLDRKMFKQPEGITFDSEGNMYIANEARGGKPNIIIVPIKH